MKPAGLPGMNGCFCSRKPNDPPGEPAGLGREPLLDAAEDSKQEFPSVPASRVDPQDDMTLLGRFTWPRFSETRMPVSERPAHVGAASRFWDKVLDTFVAFDDSMANSDLRDRNSESGTGSQQAEKKASLLSTASLGFMPVRVLCQFIFLSDRHDG